MPKHKTTAEKIEKFQPEIRLLDELISKGPGSYKLRLTTHSAAVALRHRIYQARSLDRQLQQASGALPPYPYDSVRILGPSMSADGLNYFLPILVLSSPDAIVGLIGGVEKA